MREQIINIREIFLLAKNRREVRKVVAKGPMHKNEHVLCCCAPCSLCERAKVMQAALLLPKIQAVQMRAKEIAGYLPLKLELTEAN